MRKSEEEMTVSTATRGKGGLVTQARLPHLHYEMNAGPENLVEITISGAANVQLMDDRNYEDYCVGKTFHYHGGHATHSPVRLRPPPPRPLAYRRGPRGWPRLG